MNMKPIAAIIEINKNYLSGKEIHLSDANANAAVCTLDNASYYLE